MKTSTCTTACPAGYVLATLEPCDFRKLGSRLVKATVITGLRNDLMRMRKAAQVLGLRFRFELGGEWVLRSGEKWPSGASHYLMHQGELKRPLVGSNPTVRVLIGGMDR